MHREDGARRADGVASEASTGQERWRASRPTVWPVQRVAYWGAAVGALISVAQLIMAGSMTAGVEAFAVVVGGAIGGAAMGAGLAWLHNWAGRPKF